MLEYLPLLDGWTIKRYKFPDPGVIVAQNQLVPVFSKEKAIGWLLGVSFVSSDSEMQFWLETEYLTGYATPSTIYAGGGLLPGPYTSDVSLYNRPSPSSTYGTYVGDLLMVAYPFPVPHNTKVKCYVTLGSASTQPAALAQYVVDVLEVTNEKTLINSYRRLKYGRWAGMLELSGAVNAALQAIHASPADIEEALK
jgi:hypothetical protein